MEDTVPEPATVLVDGPWRHRDVSANGTRLHVAELGSGPLVLLLHGFPQFWWAWRHQLTALAAAGYRVVAPDLRGYGASDKPPRGYDAFTLSDDVAGLVRALGEPDAAVVGHDWGGLLGWTTAVRHPMVVRRLAILAMPHPLRLRHQIAADPRGQGVASRYMLGFQLPWRPERVLVAEDAAHVATLLRGWGGPGYPDAEAERRYRSAMRVPGVAHSSLEYHRWIFRSLFRPDGARFGSVLRRSLRMETLQIHGEMDRCFLPSTAQGSGRYVSGPYTWRLLGEIGHFPHEEAPDLVNAELLGWLRP
ncbi:putative hydrolase or acyltransferase of alpha/beta superfamily [Frankia casuarinae]|jgi:pimeloyl-ACP methyl ester carboxylesterase|uniref:Alpha/beta hydrolase fold n=1 Tax=Frankia casuarinae (strain DSM 45818 / CECT 9043 / HFP020203 / CcI3) TaxID=106370 RepID=Q2J503_FRACC|nr:MULTISPECIES: alpha/beta hydrolase [Frankia]ABD13639.1 alpha/beta hydrolase fold [Frankia casuarinae]ETA02592.1 putative hydrolase or acyltransferase of alpha/beta superfamily [Frankia sp. CcI6]EYT92788.1 putative hydrolase or acyltransferase of alpha/beta superfamily [Frankia casuarinae]KDA43254.1 putative hydrolase or acyltransferase of alpha/beta superfamily [Frankia sp. BMG5.23]KEZ37973.1 putative hydrolase or acyltransferase of alpha/beta superfamily [Frankia sp. CeD]